MEALTDLSANTTVAVTTIQGGTVTNSIPPICSCIVDLRFGSPKERDRVLTALEEICAKQYVPDTTTELEIREFMGCLRQLQRCAGAGRLCGRDLPRL